MLILSFICLQNGKKSVSKPVQQGLRLVCWHNKRIEIVTVPFNHRAVWFDEMRFPQIEEQPFILGRHYFVAPTVRFRLTANISSKYYERVAMIAIGGDYCENCVAAREKDGES